MKKFKNWLKTDEAVGLRIIAIVTGLILFGMSIQSPAATNIQGSIDKAIEVKAEVNR